ncbi:MAG: hypothetical protein JXA21_13580 [Anaerolineae bacterium]|nr:hypothetical protein [Anaerolineae bacterium]
MGITAVLVLGGVAAECSVLRPPAPDVKRASFTMSPGYTQKALPGETVAYAHILTNTGGLTDTFSLEVASSLDWPVALFGEAQLATTLMPVQLGPAMSTTFGVSVTVPVDVVSGTVAHTLITATALSDTTRITVTDVTTVYRLPGVELSPAMTRTVVPGNAAAFVHTLTNTSPITDMFAIEAVSLRGWPVTLLSGDTLPGTTIQLPLKLGELESADFLIKVEVPTDTVPGIEEPVIVTVTSVLDEQVTRTVTDVIMVGEFPVVCLPLVQNNLETGLLRAKLGLDFADLITSTEVLSYDVPLTQDLGASWVRVLLSWEGIERAPGQYYWDEYDPVFARFEELGLTALVATYGAPPWAAVESCGPLSDTVALENFLDVLVPRYTRMVGAWEFVNEPDNGEPYPYGPIIGCWGLHPAEYAQQLAVFSTKVKALAPGDLVFFGGLAYDAWETQGFIRDFFEKALQHGAGPFFDGVSLHYYPINLAVFPTMAHKINEIRDIMERNDVYDKRIWITETGMWVNADLDGSVERQRDFIVRDLSRGFAAGADNLFWFDPRENPVPGTIIERWLIGMDHQPINAYYTFQHFANKIQGFSCVGQYNAVPADVEAYKYVANNRSLYVLWSNTVTQTVTLPSTVGATLTDRDGTTSIALPAQEGQVTFDVGTLPVFVEIP